MSINRNALKSYAPNARREFIAAVAARAAKLGITKSKIAPAQEQGDLVIIGADAYPKRVGEQRLKLISRIALHGFDQTMEEVAYTWFNRLLAIRFMELHGYLDHGYRVLSHPSEKALPEILEHAEHLDFPGLNRSKVVDLKLDGTKDAELYRLLLIAQCNALHRAMPFLFEKIDDETELLLPDNLLHTDSLIRKLVTAVDEADWQEIEIIGWLYQFYISEKKDQVIGKVVKSDDIPAATQLFTPNWIVRYMVQNSLGAKWLATYPDSTLKTQMEYYIEPAEQTEEVQRQLVAITPKELNPEELTLIDPACGSGHILVEAYNLFKAIYLERGYPLRDVPRLILEKNLFGLDIDDRAAQMAGFALLMRARADDRRILSPDNPPLMHVMAIQDTKGLDADEIARALLPRGRFELVPSSDLLPDTLAQPTLAVETHSGVERGTIESLIDLFVDGKTLGSLITVPNDIAQALPALRALIAPHDRDGLFQQNAKLLLRELIQQAELLAREYDVVVANPPFMNSGAMNKLLASFLGSRFADFKADTFSAFISRSAISLKSGGRMSFMTPFVWMFISKHENLRELILRDFIIHSLVKPSYTAFYESAIVPICTFSLVRLHNPSARGTFFDLGYLGGASEQPERLLQANSGSKLFRKYVRSALDFQEIPGSPISFWLPDQVFLLFKKRGTIKDHSSAISKGIFTGNNDRFLRQWHEVSSQDIENKCWQRYNKAGGFRKWYGIANHVVDWRYEGKELKSFPGSGLSPFRHFGKTHISWGKLTSGDPSFRIGSQDVWFDDAAPAIVEPDSEFGILALMNSSVARLILKSFNPTLNLQTGDVAKMPFPPAQAIDKGAQIARNVLSTYKSDWDAYETSWDFSIQPLLSLEFHKSNVSETYAHIRSHWQRITQQMQQLEEENNHIFIDAYGLQDELSPEVPLNEVTLICNPHYRYGGDLTDEEREVRLRSDTMRELISHAVGCVMGRYSLTEPGLIYARAGNEGFDPLRYGAFPADSDGIVPITESEWFDDDAAARFEEFLKVAWSPETVRENLRFVAASLMANGGSDPQKAIRSYFAKSFFKDHLKTYKKRPIYWLFSSGKLKAFECLVYLHRYNESTLSRMRMEYVTPLQSRMAARIEQLSDDIASASSSAARTRAQKDKDSITRQLEELRVFDEQLRHYADQRIALDLADGVKVNYGKFGNLLAEVKAITGEE